MNPKKRLRRKPKVLLPAKPSTWKRVKKFFTSIYMIVSALFLIVSAVLLRDQIRDFFATKHEKFEREKFIKGIFIPDHVLYGQKEILIGYGSLSFAHSIKEMQEGYELNPGIYCKGETPFNIKLEIVYNRLNITLDLKDFQFEQIVGKIYKNRWVLVKENMFDWHDDDKYLEIIDKQGYVMCSLVFKEPNIIIFNGYSIGDHFSSVMGDTLSLCIDKKDSSYKDEFISKAKLIKPIYEFY